MGYAQATARLRRAITKVVATGTAGDDRREVFGDAAQSPLSHSGPDTAPLGLRDPPQPL